MAADSPHVLDVSAAQVAEVRVLTVSGVLDHLTYCSLRDAVIKAALDSLQPVVVDVSALEVPVSSAWAVFTSARWHVGQWPGVPIALVCRHAGGRDDLRDNGITRRMPVFHELDEAVDELARPGEYRRRRRAEAELPALATSLRCGRDLARQWLADWDRSEFAPLVAIMVTELIENVLIHTTSVPGLRLESSGDTVTVAVADASTARAVRRERFPAAAGVSGLDVVAAICRRWGNAPTPAGKTVWAVVGRENLRSRK